MPRQGAALEPAGESVQAEEETALGAGQGEGAEAEIVQNLESGEGAHAAGQRITTRAVSRLLTWPSLSTTKTS